MGQAGEKNLIEAKDVGVCVFKKKRGGGRGGKKNSPFFGDVGVWALWHCLPHRLSHYVTHGSGI